ncbi:DUF6896 domain-containing protein [Hymenobacter montanus]|uniref:DUF6896 domain-containing protein n=1 Tax=Hymenobacter montanus TaxID=2771359 RepID=UPI0037428A8F
MLNGNEFLSDNWWFDVHGEHCLFRNAITGQSVEVSLGNKESIGNLDPYFFHHFLQTTNDLSYLVRYFENSFSDVLNFFEAMERQKKMVQVAGVYRKV